MIRVIALMSLSLISLIGLAQEPLHQQQEPHPDSCPEEIHRIVAERMKDPAATLTRYCEDHTGKGKRIICGEYNGKNSYGAYIGYRPFYVIGDRFVSRTVMDSDRLWFKVYPSYCEKNQ